jgi:hypothetical protein
MHRLHSVAHDPVARSGRIDRHWHHLTVMSSNAIVDATFWQTSP